MSTQEMVAPGEIDEMSRSAHRASVPLCNRPHPRKRVLCTRAAGHDEVAKRHHPDVAKHVSTRKPFFVTVEVWT